VVSHPSGLQIDARGTSPTPFSRDVIQGDLISISASHQTFNGLPYEFDGWSDLGPASRDLVVNANRTMEAWFSVRTLRVPDRVVTEPGSTTSVNVPIGLSQISKRTIGAKWLAVADTAGSDDVVLGSGTLSIPSGASGTTVPVTVKADTLVEPTERFYLWIYDPTNAAIADALAEVQILDNDGPTRFPYLPGFDGPTADLMAFAAAKLGVPVRDVPKMGGDLMRFFVAVDPNNVPQLTPQWEGDYRYAAVYDAAGRDEVVAAASKYGVNGTQMHIIGTKLLVWLALLP
jgi:hypothetical protein